MTALAILAAVVAIAYCVLVHPVLREMRARRRDEDAADEAQADQFIHTLRASRPAAVDHNSQTAQAARHARTASDLPHGSARRGTHL